jgi:hypothetical protein
MREKQGTPNSHAGSSGGGHQIARRTAADLEHPAAGGRRETVDQAIASQQVMLARHIVEMPLPAIEAVHEGRAGGVAHVSLRGCRDGSRHRSPNDRVR